MSKNLENKGPLKDKRESKRIFLNAYFDYLDTHHLKHHHIAEELGIKLSTIKDTVDWDSNNLNATFVIAFCLKYRTIDIDTIYLKDAKEPEELKPTYRNFSVFRHSHDCHVLDDKAFMGTFYGYCRNTIYHHIIDDFVININANSYNEIQAEMILNSHNQKREVTKKYLYGKPMHLEPNIIYIVFQSDHGDDMFIMSYNYFKINSGKQLYCRCGSLMTPCRSTDRYPQLQSFVLLDKPVLPENLNHIDGYLHLIQDKIIVPAEVYDSEANGLLTSDETVKTFFKKCKDMHYNKEEYYCFSEKVLLALGEANGVDFDTTAATIMTLKNHSINPKVVDFPNNKTYSKFFAGLTTEKEE